jgi:hypothetical protein
MSQIKSRRRRRAPVVDSDFSEFIPTSDVVEDSANVNQIHVNDTREEICSTSAEPKGKDSKSTHTGRSNERVVADVLTVDAFLQPSVDSSPTRPCKRQRRYGRRNKAKNATLVPNSSSDDLEELYRRGEHMESISDSPNTSSPSREIHEPSGLFDNVVAGKRNTDARSFTTRMAQAAVLAHVDIDTQARSSNDKPSSLHLVNFAPPSPSPLRKRQKCTSLVDPRRTPFVESTFSANINSAVFRLPCTPLSKLTLSNGETGMLHRNRVQSLPKSRSGRAECVVATCPTSRTVRRIKSPTELRPIPFVLYTNNQPQTKSGSSNE